MLCYELHPLLLVEDERQKMHVNTTSAFNVKLLTTKYPLHASNYIDRFKKNVLVNHVNKHLCPSMCSMYLPPARFRDSRWRWSRHWSIAASI